MHDRKYTPKVAMTMIFMVVMVMTHLQVLTVMMRFGVVKGTISLKQEKFLEVQTCKMSYEVVKAMIFCLVVIWMIQKEMIITVVVEMAFGLMAMKETM